MNEIEFAQKVLEMREAQSKERRSGLWSDLQVVQRHQKEVDELVARILDKQKELF